MQEYQERLLEHLEVLYPLDVAARARDGFVRALRPFLERPPIPGPSADRRFDHTDVVLITYPDLVREPGRPTLETLREFLGDHFGEVIRDVHLLPHYPATSDDGFAVADHLAVSSDFGSWGDVKALAGDFRLMLDAVVNHASAGGAWFRRWCAGDSLYEDFFIAIDPDEPLSVVARPRATPVLTAFETSAGRRWVWTTFGPDHVDLNYTNPEVLVRMSEILLTYVVRGARMLRLDAVAYLWKRVGTPCIHLPETHEIVRLWRTMLDAVAPGVLLLTETNVPHEENVAYFGNGHDEAHLIYQFPLAPLVLWSFLRGDASVLGDWLASVRAPSEETTFLNFLASHDGVGLRPVEGLLAAEEINELCETVAARGGAVSYRTEADGSLSPYELNSVYFDALSSGAAGGTSPADIDRFLAAHSILLALAGIPAIYVHSLIGSRNWRQGVESTGRARTINRQKFDRATLDRELSDRSSVRHEVMTRLLNRISVRMEEPAFHPNAPQQVVPAHPQLLVLERTRIDRSARVVCIHSVSDRPRAFHLEALSTPLRSRPVDLCNGETLDASSPVSVGPFGVRWLQERTNQ